LVIGFANCVILYFNVDKNVSTYCKHLLWTLSQWHTFTNIFPRV
jgi:hypothetical protein